jgi:hypothetical protein
MANTKKYYKLKTNPQVLAQTKQGETLIDENNEWDEITQDEYNALSQINELKSQLAKTDYQAIKYAEGWISEEDYAPIKAQRQSLRDQINELEEDL